MQITVGCAGVFKILCIIHMVLKLPIVAAKISHHRGGRPQSSQRVPASNDLSTCVLSVTELERTFSHQDSSASKHREVAFVKALRWQLSSTITKSPKRIQLPRALYAFYVVICGHLQDSELKSTRLTAAMDVTKFQYTNDMKCPMTTPRTLYQ